MTILSWYCGFEVIVFSTVTIVTIYSIVNPKELSVGTLGRLLKSFGTSTGTFSKDAAHDLNNANYQ